MSKTQQHLPRDLSLLQRRRLSWAVAKGSPLVKAAKRAGMKAPLARELGGESRVLGDVGGLSADGGS